jgi:hypothetical protein
MFRDRVHYAVPLDWLVHNLVRPDIERIFRYRVEKLRAHFGSEATA